MASSTHPDRDASGAGQRFEIDLTRQDIRSGLLLLPGSMLEVFEAGPIALHDPARERDYTLTFTPPRSLTGLEPFIEAHGLQPNDKLIFVLGLDRGELHARKRPPKKRPKFDEPPILETDPPPAAPPAETAPPQVEASESGWVVREVRRGTPAGPPPSRQEPPPGMRGDPDEVEIVHEPAAPPPPRQPAPRQPPAQAAEESEAWAERQADVQRQLRTPPPSAAEVLDLVKAHLAAPDTPAIVRLEDVAQVLLISDEAAWHALERLAREPDSGVSLIRRDFYRVSRQAQPKSG
jgi:hypothetical protein